MAVVTPMEDRETMLSFCKAMADESRLKIVGLLSTAEHNVQELAGLLGLKEPTVSHHLAILKALDLVRRRIDGNTHWYRLDQDVLRKIGKSIFNRESLVKLAVSVEMDDWQRKVLANFLDGERLIEIPVSRKKRWVILRWLAARFEDGQDYSEAELNARIKVHHHDCATLRRELIGYRMFAREKGVYWRLPESQWRGFGS